MVDFYYTIKEVARIMKVSTQTVHDWIEDGKLRAFRSGSRIIRVSADEMARLEKEHTSKVRYVPAPPTPPPEQTT